MSIQFIAAGEALPDENTWNRFDIPESIHQSFKTSTLQKVPLPLPLTNLTDQPYRHNLWNLESPIDLSF